MLSLKNCVVGIFALALLSVVGYAQTFNNVVVDCNSGDQSETSIAVAPNTPSVLMATWNDFSNGSYSQPGYAFSTDGGNTWVNEDKPYMTIDNSGDSTDGRSYVAWTDIPDLGNRTIYLAFPSNETDLSGPWTTVTISGTSAYETGAVPAVGPDGTLYVAYYSGSSSASGGTGEINVAMSTNSGNSFVVQGVESITSFNNYNLGHLRVSSFPTIALIRLPETFT
ncbi:MAG: hypothetical protein M1469_00045 [Bacteroidetes bacterium]|nr:hypothetical protein [Bacteroidota bacterium]